MNNEPIGACSSETSSHLIDMNSDNILPYNVSFQSEIVSDTGDCSRKFKTVAYNTVICHFWVIIITDTDNS
jgi:hypothetical protein